MGKVGNKTSVDCKPSRNKLFSPDLAGAARRSAGGASYIHHFLPQLASASASKLHFRRKERNPNSRISGFPYSPRAFSKAPLYASEAIGPRSRYLVYLLHRVFFRQGLVARSEHVSPLPPRLARPDIGTNLFSPPSFALAPSYFLCTVNLAPKKGKEKEERGGNTKKRRRKNKRGPLHRAALSRNIME